MRLPLCLEGDGASTVYHLLRSSLISPSKNLQKAARYASIMYIHLLPHVGYLMKGLAFFYWDRLIKWIKRLCSYRRRIRLSIRFARQRYYEIPFFSRRSDENSSRPLHHATQNDFRGKKSINVVAMAPDGSRDSPIGIILTKVPVERFKSVHFY